MDQLRSDCWRLVRQNILLQFAEVILILFKVKLALFALLALLAFGRSGRKIIQRHLTWHLAIRCPCELVSDDSSSPSVASDNFGFKISEPFTSPNNVNAGSNHLGQNMHCLHTVRNGKLRSQILNRYLPPSGFSILLQVLVKQFRILPIQMDILQYQQPIKSQKNHHFHI